MDQGGAGGARSGQTAGTLQAGSGAAVGRRADDLPLLPDREHGAAKLRAEFLDPADWKLSIVGDLAERPIGPSPCRGRAQRPRRPAVAGILKHATVRHAPLL